MDRELLKTVIKESEERKFPEIIPRDIEIPLDSQKIIAITGPRRSGKTYLFYYFITKLLSENVSRKQILYISFDDPRLLPMDSLGLEEIYEAYRELNPNFADKTAYIFFDEIQNVDGWELGIRRLHDTGKFRIFLTGSSSKLLSKEIATELRGRALNFELFPFSFSEVIRGAGITLKEDTFYSEDRFAIKNLLNEYLDFGGFPEVVLEKDPNLKLRILKEYFETMYFKDLIERYHIKNKILLRELMRFLTTNIANVFSVNSFYKWMSKTYKFSRTTLLNYISFLEDSGVFHFLKKFSFSLKAQGGSLKKPYIVDNGLRKAYGFEFSKDRGKNLENVVFMELRRRKSKNPLMKLFYFQDYQKHEVDFIVSEGRNVNALIQVCADIENILTREREIRSLIKASSDIHCGNLIVITLDYEGKEEFEGKVISFVPVWKWLLK